MSEDRPRPGQTPLDRVLEELTAAPPPSGLRARVLARIASGDRSRRSVRWSVALPAAAAISALTWAAVLLTRRPAAPPVRPPAERRVVVASPTPPVPATASRPVAPRATVAAARTARPASRARAASRSSPVMAAMRPRAPADDGAGLPALAPPPPVRAADLEVVPIGEPPSLEVPGLRIEPLSPAGPNGSGRP